MSHIAIFSLGTFPAGQREGTARYRHQEGSEGGMNLDTSKQENLLGAKAAQATRPRVHRKRNATAPGCLC